MVASVRLSTRPNVTYAFSRQLAVEKRCHCSTVARNFIGDLIVAQPSSSYHLREPLGMNCVRGSLTSHLSTLPLGQTL